MTRPRRSALVGLGLVGWALERLELCPQLPVLPPQDRKAPARIDQLPDELSQRASELLALWLFHGDASVSARCPGDNEADLHFLGHALTTVGPCSPPAMPSGTALLIRSG